MPVFISDQTIQEAVNLAHSLGSKAAAARHLGIPRETLKSRLDIAIRRGIKPTEQQLEVKQGYSPEHDMTHVVPQPMVLRGTSTLYDKNGGTVLQWVKTRLDDKKVEEAIIAAIDILSQQMPREKKSKPPTHVIEHLCNAYTFTDTHVGMYAWDKETGADWDLSIAEKMLTGAFDYLVEASPPAKTCVVCNLGDFMHFDSLAAITPTHGHLLDADSRFSKVVQIAVKILRYIINKALQKHEEVIVVMMEGNHDMASSVWLRHLFSLLYENEPRVKVVNQEMAYCIHQHGKTLLTYHHGHLKKPEELPLLFAAQFPSEWGSTTKRYCHTGHRHHSHEKEFSGMTVIQHQTIAARDAHSARHGYIADRKITAITYHSEHGEVARTSFTPEMLS